MDIGTPKDLLEKYKEVEKKYLSHSKDLTTKTFTPLDTLINPTIKKTVENIYSGRGLSGGCCEAPYKKTSPKEKVGGTLVPKEQMKGTYLFGGKKRVYKKKVESVADDLSEKEEMKLKRGELKKLNKLKKSLMEGFEPLEVEVKMLEDMKGRGLSGGFLGSILGSVAVPLLGKIFGSGRSGGELPFARKVGGKKKVSKKASNEGGKAKRPETKWMKFVKETKAKHPEMSLKEVLKYISENKLYKKE